MGNEALRGDVSYKVVASGGEATVVAELEPDAQRSERWQTEAELEEALISQLERQAYERLEIHEETDLNFNLRTQLERLNGIEFSEDEWSRFLSEHIARRDDGIEQKTFRIQEDEIQSFRRDDGTTKNVRLVDKEDIHNNRLQVINQYEAGGTHRNRYDVTILVNGLPLVHIELKRRGVQLREAFNQIDRYQSDSFWAGSGLFEYVQIFVISNGTYTKYYSNTTRVAHIEEARGSRAHVARASRSFEFTSFWADAMNHPITDLMDFARTFLAKHTILNILTRYCVFTTDHILMVMRPYQIVATERILNRILVSENERKRLGTTDAGGYVWHTTGSGKTLTSFKTAQLATALDGVSKVLFVVDRKDLDYQTIKEYEKFQKGAVNSNSSTAVLARQLSDPKAKIIVTTVQKLSNFISRNSDHAIYWDHVVIIFDECHRSQFGDMHKAIAKAFKHYHMFGFTGTPIFSENAGTSTSSDLRTTAQAFGECLHSYTIVDAIRDGNVLPFRMDYVNTMRMKEGVRDERVVGIDRECALLSDERVSNIVAYLLDHFDQKTKRQSAYLLEDKRVMGFNSILATQSIAAARKYYREIKRQLSERGGETLKVALIYSFAPNGDDPTAEGFMPEEGFDPSQLDQSARDDLDSAICDYNESFGTNFDTSTDGFEGYYKDLSMRMKEKQVDLTVVVNMFLTGFDAKAINTLWVDKNLRLHGLLQAYSRTNRILNSVKTYGNIVCFRDLESETDASLALFGDNEAHGTVLLKPYEEYRKQYADSLVELQGQFVPGAILESESAEKRFIGLWGFILRLRNILTAFDEFENDDPLLVRDYQDYGSMYSMLYDKYRRRAKADVADITDDIIFEVELVKQIEVNIDYILAMVERYRTSHGKDKEIVADMMRVIDSSITLRNKRDLIRQFVDSLDVCSVESVHDGWRKYVDNRYREELDSIIRDENLDPARTRIFMSNAFRDGEVKESGTAIASLMPPISRFTKGGEREERKHRVLEKLNSFFARFHDIS